MGEFVGSLAFAHLSAAHSLWFRCAIEALGPMQDAPPDSHADVVVDMAGRVVVPGLVNTHHHMFQSLTRCVAQGKTLFGWLKEL